MDKETSNNPRPRPLPSLGTQRPIGGAHRSRLEASSAKTCAAFRIFFYTTRCFAGGMETAARARSVVPRPPTLGRLALPFVFPALGHDRAQNHRIALSWMDVELGPHTHVSKQKAARPGPKAGVPTSSSFGSLRRPLPPPSRNRSLAPARRKLQLSTLGRPSGPGSERVCARPFLRYSELRTSGQGG
jgi:hypothetical protein